MKQYCLGFMFSEDMKRVLMIRKLKPEFQKNKMNGIGGMVEPGETSEQAMVRECIEETGLETTIPQWKKFCVMQTPIYLVDCFWSIGDIDKFQQLEKEQLEIITVKDLNVREDLCHNIMWLVHLILDKETNNVVNVFYD